MTKLGDKLIQGMKEAVDCAEGNPAEGTRKTYLSYERDEWITEEFREGSWRIISTRPNL